MRKMILRIGYSTEFAGKPEDVLKIADLIDERLKKVSVSYDDGVEYYEIEDQKSTTSLVVVDEVHPYTWYENLNKEK